MRNLLNRHRQEAYDIGKEHGADICRNSIKQDRQSHYDELVRLITERQSQVIKNTSSAGDKVLVEVLFDQALTIVKEVFKVKE